MSRYSADQIKGAAGLVLGGVPSSWDVERMIEPFDNLAPLSKQTAIELPVEAYPPLTTYLMWLVRVKGLNYLVYARSVLAVDSMESFVNSYQDMAEDAKLIANIDVTNFIAEKDITEDFQKLIDTPVLDITALYRYIATQELSMEFLASDELIRKAVKELRVNPYLFFAYGSDKMQLMPICWGEL